MMLADLNRCEKARLYVMDAIIGMEGNGPAGGTPKQIGLIIVSDDPVALDSVCVSMIGLDYKTVKMISAGEKSGLGIADLNKIELTYYKEKENGFEEKTGLASEMIDELKISDFKNATSGSSTISILNNLAGPLAKKVILNRPVVDYNKCTKCKVCVKACPVEPKAIEFDEKEQKIKYHYSKCIRCFCCQELCPFSAIEVKKAPLGFLLK